VDIVFIIDGSGSMKDNINAVRSHLNRMTHVFHKADIDFTLGIVIFRDRTAYNMFGLDFEVIPQTKSVHEIKNALSKVKCRGGEKALDALIRAADEVELRQNSEAHFILVTDEYVTGNYTAADVLTKMRSSNIKVDVIGLEEPFHGFITRRTGGIWLPISSLGAQ
jgi:Mg-chelatase subunit ChlD